jgi:hypothetical protein
VGLPQVGQRVREHAHEPRRHREPHACFFRRDEGVGGCDGSLDGLEDRQQLLPDLRRLDAIRPTQHQRGTDVLLQGLETTAHGGMFDAESARRACEGSKPSGAQEVTQIVPVEVVRPRHRATLSQETGLCISAQGVGIFSESTAPRPGGRLMSTRRSTWQCS